MPCPGSKCVGNGTSRSKKLPWCLPASYDKKKPPFLFTADEGEDKDKDMNLHFTFSVREVSKVTDEDQTLQIPMYFTVSWTDERRGSDTSRILLYLQRICQQTSEISVTDWDC